MSSATCWDVLGLEPGADRGAIRKAYAKRLKTIDPDVDPQSFIALREAMDTALQAEWWEQIEAQAELLPEPVAASEPELPEAPERHSPWDPSPLVGEQAPRFEQAAFDQLETMLLDADPDHHPNPRVLAAAVRRILSDPAMHRVDHADWAEHWLADTIAESIPISDPVVAFVTEHFGWDRDDSRWDLHGSIHYVVERHRGLSLLDRLANSQHPWHPAYLDLTSPEPSLPRTALFMKRQVKEVLEFVRANAPEAEGGLDPHRVALWDDRIYGSGGSGYQPDFDQGQSPFFWIMAALLVIKAIAVIATGS